MPTSSEAPGWRTQGVKADAWRDTESEWDSAVLLDLLLLTASSESLARLVPELVSRIVPAEDLTALEVIGISPTGSIRREETSRPDSGLLAWAIGCMWTDPFAGERLREGLPVVMPQEPQGPRQVSVCLPLVHAETLHGILAVAMIADDDDTLRHRVDHLTLVSRLWSVVSERHIDETQAVYVETVGAGVLTPRQAEILKAMAGGLTNREIAKLIRFSESTVRVESLTIYRHFGVHSRGEAVEAAREAGHIHGPPDPPGINRIAV